MNWFGAICLGGTVPGGHQTPPAISSPQSRCLPPRGCEAGGSEACSEQHEGASTQEDQERPHRLAQAATLYISWRRVGRRGAQIDQKGRVVEVWPTRPFRVQPPFPAFNEAVVTAIRRWVFEPALLAKKAVPVCMSVTTFINLQ